MGRLSWRQAMRQMLEVPAFYALIVAGTVRSAGWQVPIYADRAVTLLSDAAIR